MAKRKPKLTPKEITVQISKMTGFEADIAKAILEAYWKITEKAIIGQVEVPFGNIGSFSYRQIPPKENCVDWLGLEGKYSEPYNKDGYQRVYLKCRPSWTRKQKEITRWPFGEENPMSKLLDLSTDDIEEDNTDIDDEVEEYGEE